ncbi:hypothetical protein EV401DRAFT_548333 [Pisolithus croceorrhizus]|nr:hypothetical protein EV401DRAFT_548333 [Pisolithus croceorrhizus]
MKLVGVIASNLLAAIAPKSFGLEVNSLAHESRISKKNAQATLCWLLLQVNEYVGMDLFVLHNPADPVIYPIVCGHALDQLGSCVIFEGGEFPGISDILTRS